MNSSHSLSCPCYSGVTIALLHPINKPLNHLHRARDFNFICICCDFCHHLQGVESCHDSSCLQVGRDFDLILTKILPWGQACTVQWGRVLHCMEMPRPLITLAQGAARLSHPLREGSSSPCLILPSHSPCCLLSCLFQATLGSFLCPSLPLPFCF